ITHQCQHGLPHCCCKAQKAGVEDLTSKCVAPTPTLDSRARGRVGQGSSLSGNGHSHCPILLVVIPRLPRTVFPFGSPTSRAPKLPHGSARTGPARLRPACSSWGPSRLLAGWCVRLLHRFVLPRSTSSSIQDRPSTTASPISP